MGFQLEGKRVVITGAGGGVGQCLVNAFHSAGADVIACDRDAALLDALPEGSTKEKHTFELSVPEAVESAAKQIGAADVLVNNAGFTSAETISQLNADSVRKEIDGNLVGTINLTRALIPAMTGKGGGAIVTVSSVNGLGHYGNPAYAAAKAGVLAFMRAVAVECGGKGIRANAVCPGTMLTPAWKHRIEQTPDIMDTLVKHYPSNRIILPQEVANVVLFLASPLSSGITGVDLPVDGGLSAGNLSLLKDLVSSFE